MNRVVAAARRLVVPRKPEQFDSSEHDREVAAARDTSERAADELANVTALHATAIDAHRAAKEAFHADPAEANAEALLNADGAVRKQALYLDRAKRIAQAAAADLQAAERQRDEAEMAWLEARDQQFSEQLSRKVAVRLNELEKLASEIDALVINEVNAARAELQRRYELAERIGKPMPEHMYLLMGINNQASRHRLLFRPRTLANPALRWLA